MPTYTSAWTRFDGATSLGFDPRLVNDFESLQIRFRGVKDTDTDTYTTSRTNTDSASYTFAETDYELGVTISAATSKPSLPSGYTQTDESQIGSVSGAYSSKDVTRGDTTVSVEAGFPGSSNVGDTVSVTATYTVAGSYTSTTVYQTEDPTATIGGESVTVDGTLADSEISSWRSLPIPADGGALELSTTYEADYQYEVTYTESDPATQIGSLRLQNGSETLAVPVYWPASMPSPSALRVGVAGAVGSVALAPPADATYPEARIHTPDGTMAIDAVAGPRLDLIFVVDGSGSMSASALDAAQADADAIISGLTSGSQTPSIRLGYVEFSDGVDEQEPLTVTDPTVQYSAGSGGTDVGAGLQAAIDEFAANGRTASESIIILQSDTDSGGATPATEFKSDGGYLFTIGYEVSDSDGDPAALASDPDSDFAYSGSDDVGTAIPDVIKTLGPTIVADVIDSGPLGASAYGNAALGE